MIAQLALLVVIVIVCWYLIKEIPPGNPPGRRQRLARIGLLVGALIVLLWYFAGVGARLGR